MALERVESELMSLERLYAARLYEFQDMAIRKVKRLIAEGASEKAVRDANADGFFGYNSRAKAELFNLRDRIASFGRGQVNDEIKRQS